ncbi:hypothetical protein B9479_004283 [Cryptococcus floricola]|uniref:Uncharacterized protein n=1 Tax=Cryptococcus floricola TaxID=2591691 RepID=A0A5D3AXL4_9TREE|nr:hypothetical protein B9479_004283 [Cryptococcus floricola]
MSQVGEPFFIDGIKIYELRSLDWDDYLPWARSIENLFLVKGLLSILQGDEIFISPTASAEWVKRDGEAFAYLRNAVAFELEYQLSDYPGDYPRRYSEPSTERAHSRAKRYWFWIQRDVLDRAKPFDWALSCREAGS